VVGAPCPGVTLILFATACMVLAALVLRTSGRSYTRAALIQGTLPLIGFVLFSRDPGRLSAPSIGGRVAVTRSGRGRADS